MPALYLMPKSPSGPPGLWLADRMMPPKARCLRITTLAAGGDSRPSRPTSTRPKPLAAAMRRITMCEQAGTGFRMMQREWQTRPEESLRAPR